METKKKKKSVFRTFLTIVFLIALVVFSFYLFKRYSFTTEHADLYKYLGVKGDDVAIYLNDELQNGKDENINYKALKANNTVYMPLSFVKEYINNRFYYARDIQKILYCLPEEIKVAGDTDIHQIGNAPYVIFGEEPYILVDFIKDYTNIRYDMYLDEESKRVYIYSDWDKEKIAYLKSKEAARLQGGNKSPIVTDLKKGEEVKILDTMTKWIRVKTQNGYIGYIRKNRVRNEKENIPISTYIDRRRTPNHMEEKPCIGFHQVYSIYSASRLPELVRTTNGMNVIAPTWYVIKNNDGDIRSNANDAYSLWCHGKKYKVWATLNNFDIEDINEKKVFSSAITRRKMIDKILREVEVNNLDGFNLDIESVPPEAGDDYMEFVRELSIELTKIGCIFSVDTYVPYSYNKHYDLKELNDFCDYVIVMCYDEHYAGSKEAGSVSSISYVKDGINLSLEKVDRDKLIIALPFYCRIWRTTPDGKVTSQAYGSYACEASAIFQGVKFEFDPVTCQHYASKITHDGDKVECWLENEISLMYKMSEVRKANVAGSAAWKLTQEREGFFQILDMNTPMNFDLNVK